uniref:Uncharacterized protein n=1 Tax=Monopterus albus TaxID=43700 RepID=A0A3Q3QI39_MONAL
MFEVQKLWYVGAVAENTVCSEEGHASEESSQVFRKPTGDLESGRSGKREGGRNGEGQQELIPSAYRWN